MAVAPQATWPPKTQADLDAAAQSQALRPEIAASPGALFGGAITEQLLDYLPIAGALLPVLASVKMKRAPRPWDSARGLKDFLEEVQKEKASLPNLGGQITETIALSKVLRGRGVEVKSAKELTEETESLKQAVKKWTWSRRTEKQLGKEEGVGTLLGLLKGIVE